MGQIISFHKTAHGYSHIQRDQPCEDASASFRDESGRYFIAVVSDGHGQARSFRSAIGSRIAVDVTVRCLKEIAEGILSTSEDEKVFWRELLESPRDQKLRIRQLTDTILSQWYAGIQADYAENPPSPEELGEFAEYYADPKRVPEIYGATLIAALWFPKCLILLHQGDGRCDVFYGDGSVDQPIPWDARCQGNKCSSLCEESAYDAIRHCVIDLDRTSVIACYLGSDGVEDAYRDQEGTHIFYKHLSCLLAEKTPEEFDAYMEEFLPEFSARGLYSNSGSLDDVSVAGIVDVDSIRAWKDTYSSQIRRFELEEMLIYKDKAYKSKIRKHTFLQVQQQEAEEEYARLRKELGRLHATCRQLSEQKKALQDRIREFKFKSQEAADSFENLESYITGPEREGKSTKSPLQWAYSICKEPILETVKAIKNEKVANLKDRYQQLLDREKLLDTQEAEASEQLASCEKALQAQAEEVDRARQTYENYHERFCQAENEVQTLLKKIEDLDAGIDECVSLKHEHKDAE